MARESGAGSTGPTLQAGQTVETVLVQDAHGQPVGIPDLGSKVLVIFYTDPDNANLNEAFRDAVHAIRDPGKRGMGVVNMKDSWKPRWLIRRVVRSKQAKFQGTLILLDADHTLRDAWGLGDCDRRDVVIIVGRDRAVRYFQREQMSPEDINHGLQVIRELIATPQTA